MIALLWFALSLNSWAQPLEVVDVQFRPPPKAASCGLLGQREKERLKVIRELSHLTRKAGAIGQGAPPASVYEYWLTKLFMPSEDWSEISSEVTLRIRAPVELQAKAVNEGLHSLFLITKGPGFIWQSYADQLPPEMSIDLEGDLLTIRYSTFLNALCEPGLKPLTVEWVSDPEALF